MIRDPLAKGAFLFLPQNKILCFTFVTFLVSKKVTKKLTPLSVS